MKFCQSIQTKVNICSCNFCLEGDFVLLTAEKGKQYHQSTTVASDDDSDDDVSGDDSADESDDDDEVDQELYEMRAENVTSIVSKDTTIALYSSSNSLEIFYLCKMLDFGEAKETLVDKYHFNKNDLN